MPISNAANFDQLQQTWCKISLTSILGIWQVGDIISLTSAACVRFSSVSCLRFICMICVIWETLPHENTLIGMWYLCLIKHILLLTFELLPTIHCLLHILVSCEVLRHIYLISRKAFQALFRSWFLCQSLRHHHIIFSKSSRNWKKKPSIQITLSDMEPENKVDVNILEPRGSVTISAFRVGLDL